MRSYARYLSYARERGAAKTRIVYQVNLNFRTFNPYLVSLVDGWLLEVIDGPIVVYRTTEKGNDALEWLKEIDAMIPEI